MEPLNDLLTVFLGFGVFTANAAFRFEQHQDGRSQGWSARRLGYLSEEQFGYALARFAYEREDAKPKWPSFLSTNIRSFMSRRCLLRATVKSARPATFVVVVGSTPRFEMRKRVPEDSCRHWGVALSSRWVFCRSDQGGRRALRMAEWFYRPGRVPCGHAHCW
jgi:hypothetical protein